MSKRERGCVLKADHLGPCYVGAKVVDCDTAGLIAEIDRLTAELAEARKAASKYHEELVDSLRAALDERDAAIRERDARVPLGTLPIEFVAGEWILSGQDEPDAVVTYASEPSPETGHVGWCWWARGKMGEARDYVAAREAAEKSIRAHADRSGAPAPQSGPPPGSIATEVERMVRVELAKVTGPVDLEISVRTKPRTFMQEISFELSLVREQTEGCEPAVRTLAEGFDFEQAVRASLAGVSSDELDEVAIDKLHASVTLLTSELAAAKERAEKAERGLCILRECTAAERDRVYGYEMAKLRAELARRTIERDSHCEHANQESARASDYAESNESLRTALAGAEATIAKLREAMPDAEERDAIECAILDDADSFERQCVREWLARLESARKEVG